MKKIFLLTSTILLLVSCSKNSQDCHSSLPKFSLLINQKSEIYNEFTNSEGIVDTKNITIYKLINNTKQPYHLTFLGSDKNDYLEITTFLNFKNDIYTGKTETLYLQNPVKTYKIEVNGYMQSEGCGLIAYTNEIRVDGIKIEGNYLAK